MTKTTDSSPKTKSRSSEWRIPRTVSVTPDQDRYLTEALGADGNASEFLRSLIDAARDGRVNFGPAKGRTTDAVERARAYHRAKEAGMSFEEDVGRVIEQVVAGTTGISVVRNRIHNGEGVFCADFSIERDGAVLFSVQCKSSPRIDRLTLALGEAMIGTQKTGAPVITVVPYLIHESQDAVDKFKLLHYRLVTLGELGVAVGLELAGRGVTIRTEGAGGFTKVAVNMDFRGPSRNGVNVWDATTGAEVTFDRVTPTPIDAGNRDTGTRKGVKIK